MLPILAILLFNQEVRRSGLRQDIITYNTVISACPKEPNLEEAIAIIKDMEIHICQSDPWT